MSEISAGAIIYTLIDGERKYLVSKDFHGNYGFPKGHIEEGETEVEAAKREIREEVGIKIKLDTGFREVLDYVMPNGKDKRSIYFIGTYKNQQYQKQEDEVDEILLLDYVDARNILTFENMKEVLDKAEDYLRKKKGNNSSLFQSIKFVLFSLSAGIIQLGSFALLNDAIKLGWWPSYVISLVLSVLWNFTLNRNITFKSASNVPIAMAKVFAFYCVFTPLSTILGNYLTGTLGWNDYVVTIMNMVINLITEFIYQKYYVFKDSLKK